MTNRWKNTRALAARATAESFESKGDISAAVGTFTKELSIQPDNPFLLACRGRLLYVQEEWEAALADFSSALRVHPRAQTTLFFRAKTYTHLGRLSAALSDFWEVVKLDKSAADAWMEIGMLSEYLGDKDVAREARARALLLEPEKYAWLRESL